MPPKRTPKSDSPLHLALANEAEVRRLLEDEGYDANILGVSGRTPLHRIALMESVNPSVTALLIKHGADIHAKDMNNETPLIIASACGRFDVIRNLLEHGAAVTDMPKYWQTPLHLAAGYGFTDVVSLLLDPRFAVLPLGKIDPGWIVHNVENVANSNCTSARAPVVTTVEASAAKATPAVQAKSDNTTRVYNVGESLNVANLTSPSPDVTKAGAPTATAAPANCDSTTPCPAARAAADPLASSRATVFAPEDRCIIISHDKANGRTRLKLPSGAKKNVASTTRATVDKRALLHGSPSPVGTPLHAAAGSGHASTCQVLIDHGADANDQNSRSDLYSALHCAAVADRVDVAKLLIEHSACLEARAQDGQTPLHLAAQNGCLDTTRLLLDKGALLDAAADDGYTALAFAAEQDHVELVRLFLARGADIHARDCNGRHALHAAVFNALRAVQVLLEEGADVNALDHNTRTPLSSRAALSYLGSPRALLAHGAVLDPCTHDV